MSFSAVAVKLGDSSSSFDLTIEMGKRMAAALRDAPSYRVAMSVLRIADVLTTDYWMSLPDGESLSHPAAIPGQLSGCLEETGV